MNPQDYDRQMIERLRAEAEDTGHCEDFRNQCRADAARLEGELK
jgi:hypothetical protein